MSGPVFVIVGHVNRGKSSIVSTLAADETVRIDPTVGTTRECRTYPMRVGGKVLYELIDTPGFERPRQMLQWLREQETTTGERRNVVNRFLREHASTGLFTQECCLLGPVLAGAAALYVVDGSVPFTPAYEAEMEILRWTGQPRMALINLIGEESYIPQWRPILDQYFNLVHEFDAHEATFPDRLRLIRALREIHKPWEPALNEALAALRTERRQNLHDAAVEIAAMLVRTITLVQEKRLSAEAQTDAHKQPLADAYYDQLRTEEEKSREAVGQVYRRTQFQVRQEHLGALQDDLFSDDVWLRFGLSRRRLAAGGAAAGAATGGAIDAMLGGATFLLGAVVGGIIGAGAGYLGAGQLPRATLMNLPLGGKLLRIGPMRNTNFPWVLLDRALEHHRLVAGCPHARRGSVDLPADTSQGSVARLTDEQRRPIEQTFHRLRQNGGASQCEEIQFELASAIEPLLTAQEQDPSRGAEPE